MSSGVTPMFSSQSIASSGSGSLTWASPRLSTGLYNALRSWDFWIYLPSTTFQADLFTEVSSTSTPANGDYTCSLAYNSGLWYVYLYAWTGSGTGTYCNYGAYFLWPTLNAPGWNHVFLQWNADGSISGGSNGTIVNSASSGGSTTPTSVGYGIGVLGMYNNAIPSGTYIQEFRMCTGVNPFPTTGTYTVPPRQYG